MNSYQNPFQSAAEGSEPSPPQVPESAPLMPRVGAFAADCFAILVLFFIANFIIFSQNPHITEELEEFSEEMRTYQEQVREANGTQEEFGPPPEPSEEAQRMIQITYAVSLGLVLVYFVLGEFFTKGASPGKLLFRLRVVRTDPGVRGDPLALSATMLRSVIKAISLALAMTMQPLMLLLLFNYLFAFFNQDRRAVHDLLARTKVVVTPGPYSHEHQATPQNPPD